MTRPQSHYRKECGNFVLKDDAPEWHVSRPDCDKIVRCVFDALTGIAWNDDSQVCWIKVAKKRYGPHPGVWVEIESL